MDTPRIVYYGSLADTVVGVVNEYGTLADTPIGVDPDGVLPSPSWVFPKGPSFVAPPYGVSIADYGASLSASDNTAAIQAALNASDYVFIPSGVYQTGPLTIMNPGTHIYGTGPNSILSLAPCYTGVLLTTGQNPVVLRDFRLTGGSTTDKRFLTVAESARSGLSVVPQLNSRIRGITIDGFGDHGVLMVAAMGADNFGDHLIFTDSTIANCCTGLDVGPEGAAEYTTYANLSLNENMLALAIRSGNVTCSNFNISNNGTGVLLDGTQYDNNGHGNLIGCLINHSVVNAIFGDGITVGYNIVGCNINLGNITLQNCYGVTIADGIIQVAALQFGGGGVNYVRDNFMFNNPPDLPNIVVHSYSGVPDKTVVADNYTVNGSFPDSTGP